MKTLLYAFLVAVMLPSGLAAAPEPLPGMTSVTSALRTFKINAGRYPTQSEGLRALIVKPHSYPEGKHWEQGATKMPLDPWGNQYEYIASIGHPAGGSRDGEFGLYSKGPDGLSKSAGNDPDDWNSWSKDFRGKKTIDYYFQSLPAILCVDFGALLLIVAYVIRGRLTSPNKRPEQAAP
jgi:type II secretion system protein G